MSSNLDKPYRARMQPMPRYYADGLWRELNSKRVFLFAQAIAFKVLVTIVPIVILLTGVLGSVLRYREPFSAVARVVRGFLPPYQSQKVIDFLGVFQGSSGAFISIGTVGLVLAAMTLATTMRLAVASAFEQDWNEERSILRGYAFDLRMVAQVGGLFLLTVSLSFLAQALNAEGLELMRQWGLERWLRAGWRGAFDALSLLVPLLVSAAMFFQLFYFTPVPHPPRTSAALGAFVTAVLWEAAKYGFALYATYVGTFPFEGDGSGVAALTSSFGLLIAFVFWVYWSGIVLMVGAVTASLHEQRRRIREDSGWTMPPGDKLEAAARHWPVRERPDGFPAEGPAPAERLRRPTAPPLDVQDAEIEAAPAPEAEAQTEGAAPGTLPRESLPEDRAP
ncbi:MAG: YihY/virulence factor BrkB family protein [Bacteroidetes bacterium QS_8_68_28]|nr:MAG: YihY/virulence factor BrkB family protein [Bacteroidetes bacterium QS_8_68_28]